jgi:uncharacterized protein YfaS (alpha-2-macroglobulin family)/tetratricopeptide (TPR) repeat protein
MRPRFTPVLLAVLCLLGVQSLAARPGRTGSPRRHGVTEKTRGRSGSQASREESRRSRRTERLTPRTRAKRLARETAAEAPTRTRRKKRTTEAPNQKTAKRAPRAKEGAKTTKRLAPTAERTKTTKRTRPPAHPAPPQHSTLNTQHSAPNAQRLTPNASLLPSADRSYEQKSYAHALERYRAALAKGLVPAARRPQVDYRIARCLGLTRQWDAATAEAQRVAAKYAGGVWEARTRAWMMQLYLAVAHQGFKVGDRYYRGRNVPETDSPAAVEPVDLTDEDYRKAVAFGEQAKALYEKLHATLPSTAEEADLDSDLAQVVSGRALSNWAQEKKWAEPGDPSWALEPAAQYDPSWAPPKKILQLVLHAEAVGVPKQKPLARLQQAVWLRGYHSLMASAAQRPKQPAEGAMPTQVEWEQIPYPYQSRSALGVLRSMVRDYPAASETPHARLMIGQWLAAEGRFNDALAAYNELVRLHPKSPWVSDARLAIREIVSAVVSLQPTPAQAPGKKAVLQLSARNVRTVRFTAHRVKLEDMVRDPKFAAKPDARMAELLTRLGGLKALPRFYQGPPVSWTVQLTPLGAPPGSAGIGYPLGAAPVFLAANAGGLCDSGGSIAPCGRRGRPGSSTSIHRFGAGRTRTTRTGREARSGPDAHKGLCYLPATLQASPGALPARKPEKHAPYYQEITTPLARNGAYVVEAAGGPVRAGILLVISDLGAIQILDRTRAHLMVVNAGTGAPVFAASALVREMFSDNQDRERVVTSTVTTDTFGLAEQPYRRKQPYSQLRTFAWKGDRYAWTGESYNSSYGGDSVVASTAYVYTERPVYRPAQEVHFRALLTTRAKNGDWKPVQGQKVTVRVNGPRGQEIAVRKLTTGEFGSIHGDVALPAGAPLGQYSLAVYWGKDDANSGGGGFRVEEYKKPEFEVKVVPPTDPDQGYPRLGEPLTIRISARYYFGAPVATAKVKYTIVRSEWFPESPFKGPYDFLYPSLSQPSYREPWEDDDWVPIPEEQVADGTAVTNAQGEASVQVPTALKDPRMKGRHLKFAVHAEVTDASRRTIVADGEARALATAYNAFLRVRQGFYNAGDTLQADVRTLDADSRPVRASGTARVLRLTVRRVEPDGEEKYDAREVFSAPLETDAQGRAEFRWRAAREGRYEVRFDARDRHEQAVVARARTWIAGEEAGDGVFHTKHVVIVPEQTTYRLGQTARILLVADEPNATVLLTQEAGDRIIEKQVLRLSGRSEIIELPLTRKQSPDIVLSITGIRDRDLFRSQATLYVPPAEQLLSVEVSPDREKYKPGEKATFRLRARDADGQPVRTEASVGIVDASLFYIAGSSVQPIGEALYAGERGSQVESQGSGGEEVYPATIDSQPPLDLERHSWTFPTGLGKLLEFMESHQGPWEATLAVPIRDNPFAPASELRSIISGIQIGGGYSRRARAQLFGYAQDYDETGSRAKARDMGVNFSTYVRGAAAPATLPQFSDLTTTGPGGPSGGTGGRAGMGGEGRDFGRPIAVRKAFADTAYWTPAVVTDSDGEATVSVTWPDNLTQWRATARGWSEAVQVGEASTDVTTSKDLLVRLQAPRFFVERDEVVLSANVHNYTDEDQRVRVTVDLGDGALVPAAESASGPPMPRKVNIPRPDLLEEEEGSTEPTPSDPPNRSDPSDPELPTPYTLHPTPYTQWVDVPKNGQTRVDWRVRVDHPGDAVVKVVADAGTDADAMELRFPVLVHGVEKLIVRSGAMLAAANEKPGTRTGKLIVDLPAQRATDSGELIVQVSPSIAATVLDAMPYLVDYPYGCVEQTMSRFMPAVLTARTLADLGIDLKDLQKRAKAEHERIKKESPTDRPRNSGYSYPAGTPGLRDLQKLAAQEWDWRANKSPVYNPAVLKKMVAEGLARLRQMQHGDGGWGWWEQDASDPHMTAYVLQWLAAGRGAGLNVDGMLRPGFAYLAKRFAKETDLRLLASYGQVLSLDPARAAGVAAVLMAKVYPKRERLGAYSLALLALALHRGGKAEPARICLDNLQNTARVDAQAGTCSWPDSDRSWWEWYNDDVETAAAALRAFNALAPGHRLAPMVVRWLANNRRGSAWASTKATALAVQALTEYVKLHRELAPDYTVAVDVGGKFKRTFTVTAANALLFDNRMIVPAAALGDGPQTVTVTRQGRGALYYSAYLRYFTLEEGIKAAGNEIRVRRRYFRLTKPAGAPPSGRSPLTQDGYTRALLQPGDRLTSGNLVEVELLLESKNSYDYLVFEDMKPAGCEPVDLQSGYRYGNGLCSNMELRDEKVAFFISDLPQGRRMISYRLRAEVPGTFHALPLNGYAMYAPEIRCISDEANLAIDDAPLPE